MESDRFVIELNKHLSHLYAFARRINELDFAASLSGEFRGAQDAGWSTTITAHEVFDELVTVWQKREHSKSDLRVMLMLYCQLAEAGGIYESLKNIIGIATLKPYVGWPFQDLVRVREAPRRIIGPNANATFRDLATSAKAIGLSRLSSLLEVAFRDDVRNGISHADYVLWEDGLRLRNRNGGNAKKLSYAEVNATFDNGVSFFHLLRDHNAASIRSFNPPKEIVGRFSANFPMPWTVSYDPASGAFRISGSSPGRVTTPAYDRQMNINGRLGGKVLATYSSWSEIARNIDDHIIAKGFEANAVTMDSDQIAALVDEIERLDLWDDRSKSTREGEVLLASPWGFRWLSTAPEFDAVLPEPLIELQLVPPVS